MTRRWKEAKGLSPALKAGTGDAGAQGVSPGEIPFFDEGRASLGV